MTAIKLSATTSALLLACLTGEADAERDRRWSELVDEGIDWGQLLDFAEHHEILPLLFSGLSHARAHPAPRVVLSQLHDHFHATLLRNRLALQCFFGVQETLAAAGIPVVLLKGMILAGTVYEHLAVRQLGDIDILVRPDQVALARTLLEQSDYRPVYPTSMLCDPNTQKLTTTQERIYARYYHEITLQSADNLLQIDLHWALLSKLYPQSERLEADSIWGQVRRVSLDGRSVLTLSAEHQLIHTCIHATKDRWRRLKWVVDIDRIIRADQLDWARLHACTQRWNSERMLRAGLGLAHELLSTPLPAHVSRLLLEPSARADVSSVLRILLNPKMPEPRILRCLGINSTFLKLLDTMSCRRRYLHQALTMPRPEDEARFGSGPPNRPLWRLSRPLRVLTRCIGRIGRPRCDEADWPDTRQYHPIRTEPELIRIDRSNRAQEDAHLVRSHRKVG